MRLDPKSFKLAKSTAKLLGCTPEELCEVGVVIMAEMIAGDDTRELEKSLAIRVMLHRMNKPIRSKPRRERKPRAHRPTARFTNNPLAALSEKGDE